MNRREFLGESAAGAGAVLLAANLGHTAANDQWLPKMPPVKIHQVYIGRTGGIYLSRPTAEIEKFEKYLAKIEKKTG